MQLTPDDIECLMAVAKRSTMQEKWIPMFKNRLVSMGLITMDDDWPKLTALGVAELDRIGFQLASLAKDPKK